jgi:hypothetical protein
MLGKIKTENIEFNELKHHLGIIASFVKTNAGKRNIAMEEVVKIGHSVLDVYTGILSVENILEEIASYLQKFNCTNYEQYKKWIYAEGKDYRIIKLSDDSEWTLRLGEKENKFVHIHPCRNRDLTIRLNSSTLKTAILFLVSYYGEENICLKEKIDEVRMKYLMLPPIKSLETSGKLLNIISLIKSRIKE